MCGLACGGTAESVFTFRTGVRPYLRWIVRRVKPAEAEKLSRSQRNAQPIDRARVAPITLRRDPARVPGDAVRPITTIWTFPAAAADSRRSVGRRQRRARRGCAGSVCCRSASTGPPAPPSANAAPCASYSAACRTAGRRSCDCPCAIRPSMGVAARRGRRRGIRWSIVRSMRAMTRRRTSKAPAHASGALWSPLPSWERVRVRGKREI